MERLFHGVKTKETLITQLYPGKDDYIAHFNEVLPAFKDHRYITVEGKPIFVIYQPFDHPEMKDFIELWRTLAKQNGLKGIHFVGHTYNLAKDRAELMRMGFDAINVVRLFDFEKKAKLTYKCAKWRHRFFVVLKLWSTRKQVSFLQEMKNMLLKLYQQLFLIGIIHLVL